jgi:hypothetical protein
MKLQQAQLLTVLMFSFFPPFSEQDNDNLNKKNAHPIKLIRASLKKGRKKRKKWEGEGKKMWKEMKWKSCRSRASPALRKIKYEISKWKEHMLDVP